MTLCQTYRRALVSLVLLVAVAILGFKSLREEYGLGEPALTGGPTPAAAVDETGDDLFPAAAVEQVQWVLRHQRPAMVLYHSELCRPCRMMAALVRMVQRDYEPDVVFIEVITDNPANSDLLRWAGVGTIPAFYFVSRSGEGKKVVGLMTQQDLRTELARLAAEGQSFEGVPTGTPVP